MGALVSNIIEKAKKLNKTIVLPEGNDKRVLEAAKNISKNKIAKIVLIGKKDEIEKNIGSCDDLSIEVIDSNQYEKKDELIQMLYELRKEKGMTYEDATNLILNNPLYFGAMLVKIGKVDGMVGGACHSTGDLLRPALQIIKTQKGVKTVSSAFLMDMENTLWKRDKVLIFGDCAVNIEPSSEQLRDIAISSFESAKAIAGIEEPKVAMLSFSTKGSAKHENASKVVEAVEMVKELRSDIVIDGEIQFDAAIVPSVQQLKAPNSPLKGSANIFIFPDLQSGNIGYKLVQRLAGAEAIGPVCQGFAKPVNDLSRGCSVDDIISVVAITSLQTQI